jgi:7,8-dihydropterin-6-yl-methyl-4-(beta-D-ribofuranosyl)aminobenzene 5'-phosphate synthase
MKKMLIHAFLLFQLFFVLGGCSSQKIKENVYSNKTNEKTESTVKITVLLENYTIDNQYKSDHGLSVLIEYNGEDILLDVGPNSNFAKNARTKNIDLSRINHLFISHNHIDHTGGLDEFLKINDTARIYLMDNINSKYYLNVLFFKYPVGLRLNKKYYSRITQLDGDLIINNNIYFLKNISSEYQKPSLNKYLHQKIERKYVLDTFDHEGILVLEDKDELIVFNSCSHNGILNSIETVRMQFPNKKIRSYVGGLHLIHPPSKENESDENLDYLVDVLKEIDITIYTGHCTGEYSLNYLKERLGEKIQEINTGMELYI